MALQTLYHVLNGVGVSECHSIPFARGRLRNTLVGMSQKISWEKYTHYMLAEMLYSFTVGVNMEEERENTLHMFDDEVERIKNNGSHIPKWYQKKI